MTTVISIDGGTLCVDHTKREVELLALGQRGGRLWGAYLTPDKARATARALWAHADATEDAR